MKAIERLFCGSTAPSGFSTATRPSAEAESTAPSGPASGSGSGICSSVHTLERSPHQSVL
ncbi:hypothetical protein BE20_37755 [Sorangium cellulosum]|nr:hypothetical protein BE20_37755 [Sorangium cellulosum]